MNTNTASTSATNLRDLIAKVMDRFDADKDGQLSTKEFSGFLTGLIGGSSPLVPQTGSQVSGPMRPEGIAEFRGYLSGFDAAKIDNPSLRGADTAKYKAARIFQDFEPMPESLPAVIERLQAEGINARQVSFDKIDFGDGYGPIDVIQGAYPGGGVAWQWLPGQG